MSKEEHLKKRYLKDELTLRSEWKVKKKKLLGKQVKNRDKWVFEAKLVVWARKKSSI